MNDLLGLGKGTEKIIELASKSVGALCEPYLLRKIADAEAYKIKQIAKAETDARNYDLIETTKSQISADQLKSEIIHRTQERLLFKEIKKQQNIEAILHNAILEINSNNISDKDVDPDWAYDYFEKAENVYSDKMQKMWARILAQEIESPGKFSAKTLSTLQKMTTKEAHDFTKLCNLAISFGKGYDYFVLETIESQNILSQTINYLFNTPKINLADYAFGYTSFLSIMSLDLVHKEPVLTSQINKNDSFEINITDKVIKAVGTVSNYRFAGYSFTQVGNELSSLVVRTRNDQFIKDIESLLSKYAKLTV